MKTIWLTMFPWMLVVAVCYGQAETNVAPLADWRLVTSTDSMTDKQIRRAETRNEAGYCFSIYRVSSGQVYGHFSLLDENGEVLDSRLPMYRIDKLEPYDLNTGKSVSRLLAEQGIVLCESKPKWVTFLLFHGEGEPTGKLREIMEGQTVLFRYWRFGGGYRETSFDLTGARPVIASAIGVSAERPEDIKVKAEAARTAAEEAKQAAEKARQDAIQAARQKIEDAKRRRWTSSNGKFTVEAKFVGVVNGIVALEKNDGSRISVNLDRLSKEDQDFIRERKWLSAP